MAVALPTSIRCDGLNIVATGNNNPGKLFLGPVTNQGTWTAECGQSLAGNDVFQVSTATSWYDCAKSCDTNALCVALGFDPSSGSCTQYSSFAPEKKTAGSAWILTNAGAQGTTCQAGKFAGYDIECDIDYAGGDIGSQHNLKFRECIALCDKTSGCIDVAYRSGSCYLKGSLGARGTNNGVWTAKKTGAAKALTCADGSADGKSYNGFDIHCGIDYSGNDIGKVSAATFEKCIDSCAANSKCVDVSYTGTTCYLKDKYEYSNSNGNVWTATKQGSKYTDHGYEPQCINGQPDSNPWHTSSTTYYIRCDSDYAGNDFKNQQTPSFSSCMDVCDATKDCVAVTYAGGTCYMKNAVGNVNKQAGAWIAAKQQTVDSQPNRIECPYATTYQAKSQLIYQIQCGLDYQGGDLKSLTTPSVDACVEACDSTKNCIAFAYRNNNCYLKDKRYKTNPPDANVISGNVISSAQNNQPLDRDPVTTKQMTTTTTTTTTTTSRTTLTSPPTGPATCLAYSCFAEADFDDMRAMCCPGAICNANYYGNGPTTCKTCVDDNSICNEDYDCCSTNSYCQRFKDYPNAAQYGSHYGICVPKATTMTTTTTTSSLTQPTCVAQACNAETDFDDMRGKCCAGAICNASFNGGKTTTCQTCVDDESLCNADADCCNSNKGSKCIMRDYYPDPNQYGTHYGTCGIPKATTTSALPTTTTSLTQPTCLAQSCNAETDFDDMRGKCCAGAICNASFSGGKPTTCQTCVDNNSLCNQDADCCDKSSVCNLQTYYPDPAQYGTHYGTCGPKKA